ncbi:MAG: diguanylate cyclase [Lachnospiraceae bacterium]|nr:diguanylate cyclase [Lachnospiraceae bacterium]
MTQGSGNRYKLNKAVIVAAVLGGLLLSIGVVALLNMLRSPADSEIIAFDDGWELRFNGEIYEDVSIGKYIFPKMCGRGDEIILRRTLPREIDESLSFRMLLYLSAVDAYVGNELRYTYGAGLYESGKLIGSGYHYVPVHPWDAGKPIEIVIRPGENNAFSSISGVALIPAGERVTIFAGTYTLTFFASIFLVMLGYATLVVSFIIYLRGLRRSRIFFIGCFSWLIGLWSMCSDKLISIFSDNMEMNTSVEYMALFLAVIPFISLIIDMRSDASRWRRILLELCRILTILFCIAAYILHKTDTIHYPGLLQYFHFLVAAELAALIVAAVKPLRMMDRSDRYLNVGIFVFALSGGIDLARFNLQKYLLATNHSLDASVLPFGALIFIILLIMSYLVYMYDELIMQTEKRTLQRMAYIDPLTGLFNRTRCEERLSELTGSEGRYSIIEIDLNGLKKTNDTLGHSEGDALIASFGRLLGDAFNEVGEAYRMGGDEFLVIVEESGMADIQAAIERMEEAEVKESAEHPFDIAAAYGIAASDEVDIKDAEAVCRLADERMYETKQRMKGELL